MNNTNKNTRNTNKSNAPVRYFGELQQLSDNSFRVKWVEKKVKVNQHQTKWVRTNARDFARTLNKANLCIK